MRRLSASAWALVAANVIPLVGVLFFGWDLGAVMLLFWAENVVVGIFHIARIALVAGWAGLFVVPFFTLHYGVFTLVHGVFVVALFVQPGDAPGEDLRSVGLVALPGFLALLVSHGASFFTNFLRGGERERTREALGALRFRKTGPNAWSADVAGLDVASPDRLRGLTDAGALMTAPYRRVVVLHLTLIGGGLPLVLLGSPTPALVLLVLLKTGVDLHAHRQERARLAPPPIAAVAP